MNLADAWKLPAGPAMDRSVVEHIVGTEPSEMEEIPDYSTSIAASEEAEDAFLEKAMKGGRLGAVVKIEQRDEGALARLTIRGHEAPILARGESVAHARCRVLLKAAPLLK